MFAWFFFLDFMFNKLSNLKHLNVVLSVVEIVAKSNKYFRLFQQYIGLEMYYLVLFWELVSVFHL